MSNPSGGVTLSEGAAKHRRPDRKPPDSILIGHIAVFAIGATSGMHVMQYTVTCLSAICLLLVPGFLLMTHRGVELLPLLLGALGWLSFVISDLVSGVSLLYPNALGPAAFSLYLIGLTVLTDRSIDLVAWVLAGIGVGNVVFFLRHGIELTQTGSFLDLWKYGVAPGVSIVLLFGLVLARVALGVHTVALFALGLASLVLNFRSHALICLLAGAVLASREIIGDRIGRGWQFAGVLTFGVAFGNVMPALARSGIFGSALQAKTLLQDSSGLPLLMVGRTEPPLSVQAIMERPLLGWGSATNLTSEFLTRAEHLARRWGYDVGFPFEGYWRLPPNDYTFHSVLLGSWAEGGLLAALLPVWLLIACVGLVWNFTRYGRWAPLVIVVGLQTFWDIAYNPWMYNAPAVYACVALLFCAAHFRGQPAPIPTP